MLMLIWNLLQPEQLRTERLLHVSVCPGGGAGRWWGQLSRDHPKQGPNSQLEGLRRRHVALTDQILQIAQGRTGCSLADGKRDISPAAVDPPTPPPYITLQNPSLLHSQSHSMSSLSLYLSVFLLLDFSAGSQAMLKKLCSQRWARIWTAARISSTLLPLTGNKTGWSCFLYFFQPVIQ